MERNQGFQVNDLIELANLAGKTTMVGLSFAGGALTATADCAREYRKEKAEGTYLNKSYKRIGKDYHAEGYKFVEDTFLPDPKKTGQGGDI